MRKILIPIMVIAIGLAFWEQSKTEKNTYIMAITIAVFMFGLMKLSAKIPGKNQEDDDNNI